jgi:predicted DNA-binding transcriptional regulator AlpA
MTVTTMIENQPKAAITVSKMCSLLEMSRSQFYWHVKRGTFHSPLRLSNGRPYFNASQVEDNLKARELGIGVNGEYVLFYERSETPLKSKVTPASKADHTELIDSLQALGLSGLTTKQVNEAVESCYPKGTSGEDENDLLRTIFRHLKRSGVG